MTPVIEQGAGGLADKYFDQICALYDTVFSAPPFIWAPEDSEEHGRALSVLQQDSTFTVTVAREGQDLLGFAYGHRLPVTHGWWNGFPTALAEDFTAEWEGRTFTLTDFAVEKRFRGQGIGRQLHDTLLAGRREARAVLSVQPTALETRQIYEHWKWQYVGRKGPLEGVEPPYWDIYVRSLMPAQNERRVSAAN